MSSNIKQKSASVNGKLGEQPPKVCKACGFTNEPSSLYCGLCGKYLPSAGKQHKAVAQKSPNSHSVAYFAVAIGAILMFTQSAAEINAYSNGGNDPAFLLGTVIFIFGVIVGICMEIVQRRRA